MTLRVYVANLDSRDMVGTIYVEDYQTLLYTKYISCFCLIWFFTAQSTIFHLCWDRSSLVEPVLSKDKCLAQGHNTVTLGPSVLSQALYLRATVLLYI